MSPTQMILAADQDQDMAACDTWWNTSTDEDKRLVLAAITKQYDDPIMEIVSRFAQLAFGDTLLRNDKGGK